MRTRVFVVSLFVANLPRALTRSPLQPPSFPSFAQFFLPSLSRATTRPFPENALPTVISVINGRPLTTRFIFDRLFAPGAEGGERSAVLGRCTYTFCPRIEGRS